MMEGKDRVVTVHVRVTWKTPHGGDNDVEAEAVYDTIKWRIEQCLAVNICGQVGVVPGTEKMELLYGITI